MTGRGKSGAGPDRLSPPKRIVNAFGGYVALQKRDGKGPGRIFQSIGNRGWSGEVQHRGRARGPQFTHPKNTRNLASERINLPRSRSASI